MNLSDLIFTGFNRRVAALDKRTGQIIWDRKLPKGNSYTTLLLDGDLLVVSVDGYMYGLNAFTGEEIWFNEMAGFGTGVTSLASVNGSVQNVTAAAAADAAARAASSDSGSANH